MKILMMVGLIAICAFGQSNTIGFIGMSGDPNDGVATASVDIGAAKLIGTGFYLGTVAHMTRRMAAPKFQLATKIQLHMAQRMPFNIGSMSTYWSAEIGPEFMNNQAAASTTQLQMGYSIGSGPIFNIPIGKTLMLMPHFEMTKGSLQDVGWRGGILFGFSGGN